MSKPPPNDVAKIDSIGEDEANDWIVSEESSIGEDKANDWIVSEESFLEELTENQREKYKSALEYVIKGERPNSFVPGVRQYLDNFDQYSNDYLESLKQFKQSDSINYLIEKPDDESDEDPDDLYEEETLEQQPTLNPVTAGLTSQPAKHPYTVVNNKPPTPTANMCSAAVEINAVSASATPSRILRKRRKIDRGPNYVDTSTLSLREIKKICKEGFDPNKTAANPDVAKMPQPSVEIPTKLFQSATPPKPDVAKMPHLAETLKLEIPTKLFRSANSPKPDVVTSDVVWEIGEEPNTSKPFTEISDLVTDQQKCEIIKNLEYMPLHHPSMKADILNRYIYTFYLLGLDRCIPNTNPGSQLHQFLLQDLANGVKGEYHQPDHDAFLQDPKQTLSGQLHQSLKTMAKATFNSRGIVVGKLAREIQSTISGEKDEWLEMRLKKDAKKKQLKTKK